MLLSGRIGVGEGDVGLQSPTWPSGPATRIAVSRSRLLGTNMIVLSFTWASPSGWCRSFRRSRAEGGSLSRG
jgi:hypothetical protein